MDVEELITNARDAVSVKRVYGEPYEKDGLTVIPAAVVRGGGGAGSGDKDGREHGAGGGFGLTARPTGAWIIDGAGKVVWKPAIDANRAALGGQLIGLVAILVTGRVLLAWAARRPSRPPRRLARR